MKHLARCLARLYPRRWRARYGGEFEALLEDANLTWGDLFDVLSGALRMRLSAWRASVAREGEKYVMENPGAQLRIIDLKDRDIPNGYELESTIEQTGPDGSKTVVRQFFRELDLGDSYLTISHVQRDSEAAQTFVVAGTKGETVDGFRTDQTEMTTLHGDGTVRRSRQTVKTWMNQESIREMLRERYRKGPQAGLSPDQVFRKLQLDNDRRAPAL
jgi:hypothetical protein